MRTDFKVKVCGLTRREDALLAESLGADYLGFVLVPGSPRYVPVSALAALTAGLSKPRVGVFRNAEPEAIAAALPFLDIVQLHGDETAAFAAAIPRTVWKAVTLTGNADELEALTRYTAVSCFIVDSFGGGSGVRCDWNLAARAAWYFPVMLAGGLDAACVRQAIAAVHPLGVDLSSSLECAPGIKSKEKLTQFFQEIES